MSLFQKMTGLGRRDSRRRCLTEVAANRRMRHRLTTRRCLAERLEDRRVLAAVAWDGGGDGVSWHDPLNWDSDALPTSADQVTIDVPGDATIEFTSTTGAQSVTSLQVAESFVISGGTLSIAEASNIVGSFSQIGGTISGSGDLTLEGPSQLSRLQFGSATLEGAGRLIVGSDATVDMFNGVNMNRVLENFGTINLVASTSLQVGPVFVGGTRIFNRPNANFTVTAGADFSVSGNVSFLNEGTFTKTGSESTEFIAGFFGGSSNSFRLDNVGAIHLEQGELKLRGGGSSTTAIEVKPDATLTLASDFSYAQPTALFGAGTINFDAGTHDFSGTEFLPAGEVNFNGATVTIDNPIAPSSLGPFRGSVTFNVAQSLGSITVQGNVGAVGTLTLDGTTTIISGGFQGSGRVVIPVGANFNIPNGGVVQPVLENFGTVNFSGGGLQVGPPFSTGTRIFNRPGADFNVNTAANSSLSPNGNISLLNEGTLTKTGVGTTEFVAGFFGGSANSFRLDNVGTIRLDQGELKLRGGGSSTTAIEVKPDATLTLASDFTYAQPTALFGGGTINFDSGTHDFIGTEFLPNGAVNFNGATVTIDNPIAPSSLGPFRGSVTFHVDQSLDSITVQGNVGAVGTLTLTGTTTIISGGFQESGKVIIPVGATLEIPNQGVIQPVLENFGTVNFTGSSLSVGPPFSSGTRIFNRPGADFNVNTTTNNSLSPNGNIAFLNEGTFTKTGVGTTEFIAGFFGGSANSFRLDNDGLIQIRDGVLRLGGGLGNLVSGPEGPTLDGGQILIRSVDPGVLSSALQIHNAEPITVIGANVILEGEASSIENSTEVDLLAGVRRIAVDSSLRLAEGADLALTAGDFLNDGTLRLGPASTLDVAGNYSQSSTGTLETSLGGAPSSGLFGQLTATGNAAFSGALSVLLVDGFGPSIGDNFFIAQYDSFSSDFDSVDGLFLNRVQVLSKQVNSTSTVISGLVDVTDLTVESISVPTEALAGEDVSIQYTVTNLSQFAAEGDWIDSVYLSANSVLDETDLLVGRVEHTGGTTTGYTKTLTAALPAVLDGDYRVLVAVDSRGLVPDTNRFNNIGVSQEVLRSRLATLELGSSVSGVIDGREDNYFRLELPPGIDARLTADFDALEGVDVQVMYREVPDDGFFDYRLTNATDLRQEVLLSGRAGSYFIKVSGRPENAGKLVAYTLSAEPVEFDIQGVAPDHGSNAGQVTTTIRGSGFTTQTSVELVALSGGRLGALDVRFVDPNTLFATFDLTGLDPGDYDVELQQAAATVVSTSAFNVDESAPGELLIDVSSPERIRPGFVAQVTIEWRNVGNTDIPAQLIQLTAEGARTAPPALPGGAVSFVQRRDDGTGDSGPRGSVAPLAGSGLVRTASGFKLTALPIDLAISDVKRLFLGINEDGPAGVLPPGASGKITFDFQGPNQTSPPVLVFTASIKSPDQVFPWGAHKEELRPPGFPTDAWDVVFEKFLARVGSDIGDYETALASAATYLSELGQPTGDVATLLSFLFEQEDNGYPRSTLSGGIDAVAPASNLPLAFGRSYQQSISSRYRLGALGRGWTHPYEMTLAVDGDQVVIESPTGNRFFQMETDPRDPLAPSRLDGLSNDPGVVIDFDLDSLSGLLIDPDGAAYQFTNGRLVEIIYPINELLKFERITLAYTNDLLTTLKHSNGQTFTLEYDAAGRMNRLIDQVGRETTYKYDAAGEHLVEVSGPYGAVTYTYQTGAGAASEHALTSVTDSEGSRVVYEYDELGRLIRSARNGGGEAIDVSYGPQGTVRFTDADARTSTVFFNVFGQAARIDDPSGRMVLNYFDENQHLDLTRLPENLYVDYTYNEEGYLVRRVDAAGESIHLDVSPTSLQCLGYDFTNVPPGCTANPQPVELSFRLRTLMDELGIQTSYRYEGLQGAFGRDAYLDSIVYPDGSTESFKNDPVGNVIAYANRADDQFEFTYNAFGQVLTKEHPDGSIDRFGYDNRGNLVSATDTSGTILFAYDLADRLTKVSYPGGRFLEYTYDTANRRTSMTDQDGLAVRYSYDALGRLDGVRDQSNETLVSYAYDIVGRLAREDRGNGTFTTYEYDEAGQLIQLVNHAPDGTENSRFDYRYDDLGRRTQMVTLDGNWNYEYDAIGQLTGAQFESTNPVILDQDLEYEYDAAGNRVRVTSNGIATSYSTNNLNQYSQVGDAAYEYDMRGNLIKIDNGGLVTMYSWDDEGHLIGVEKGADTWAYEYDALGQRIASVHNGVRTQYLVDPTGLFSVVGEYDASDQLVAQYTHGLGLVSRADSSGNNAFYDFDAIGSTAGLTAPDGSYLNSYSYLPFGESLAQAETIDNPFEYVGMLGVARDNSGLDFMRARYYLPMDGRFTAPDPFGIGGGDANLYTYSVNDPVGVVDPSGESIIAAISNWIRRSTLHRAFAYTMNSGLVRKLPPPPNPNIEVVRHAYPRATTGIQGFATMPTLVISGLVGTTGVIFGVNPLEDTFNFLKDPGKETFFAPTLNALSEQSGYSGGQDLVSAFPELGTYFGGLACDLLGCDLGEDFDLSVTSQINPFDPNDITGPRGFGPEGYIAPTDRPLEYTVRFENLDEATAPAQVVIVTQQLDPDLDFSTLELKSFGFGDLMVEVPEGRDFLDVRLDVVEKLGVYLDIDADFNTDTGLLTWTFTSLDPQTFDLPADLLTGFLPPNRTAPEGQGVLRYSLRHKSDLATGAQLEAKASIYFDVNEPIDTNTALNTIDRDAPNSMVLALPEAVGTASFTVDWSGQDVGSGIAGYDLYVSHDGGPFETVLSNTTETSYEFTGESGSTYGFVTVARDNVGNLEPMPEVADTQTLVILGAWVNPRDVFDVDDSGEVTALDALLVINELARRSVSDPGTSFLTPLPPEGFAPPFYDVSEDAKVTALDALRVINEMARRSLLEPELIATSEPMSGSVLPGIYSNWRGDRRATASHVPFVINPMERGSEPSQTLIDETFRDSAFLKTLSIDGSEIDASTEPWPRRFGRQDHRVYSTSTGVV